jgi:hypothetical protein
LSLHSKSDQQKIPLQHCDLCDGTIHLRNEQNSHPLLKIGWLSDNIKEKNVYVVNAKTYYHSWEMKHKISLISDLQLKLSPMASISPRAMLSDLIWSPQSDHCTNVVPKPDLARYINVPSMVRVELVSAFWVLNWEQNVCRQKRCRLS